MLREHFGDSAPFVILLRGPARQLDRQGPALIRTLRRNPDVTTLSPWDLGTVQRLRPSPREAIVIADFHVGIERGGQRDRPGTEPDPRDDDPAAGSRDPDRLRDALAGDPGRLDRRHQARRADRPADPADRPAARLPLAGRRGDTARLRRRDRDRLARAALDPDRLVQRRRLRADRLHDDGPGARGRLRAADGLALPRRAGRAARRPTTPPARRAAPPAAPPSSPAAR